LASACIADPPTAARAQSLGSGVVLQFDGQPLIVLAQKAPFFPYMVPVPYNDDNGGIYMDVRILLPSEKTKFNIAIAKDGNALELTWTWPKSFQSDKQLIKEPGICARAKRAIKETIASFRSQSNDFSTTQRYPLPMKVLLSSPDYYPFTTQDKHTYVVVTLIAKMPDMKNKKARAELADPDPPSDDE
jgi:hypothetical protein